jgi:hypothetical protein
MTGRPYLSVGGELAGTGGTAVAAALPSQWAVSVDNHKTALTAIIIGGSNYVGLRDLGRVMDFGVTWKERQRHPYRHGNRIQRVKPGGRTGKTSFDATR